MLATGESNYWQANHQSWIHVPVERFLLQVNSQKASKKRHKRFIRIGWPHEGPKKGFEAPVPENKKRKTVLKWDPGNGRRKKRPHDLAERTRKAGSCMKRSLGARKKKIWPASARTKWGGPCKQEQQT